MRILLANNHLTTVGGTERWTETMFHALKAMGHEVHVYSPTPNKLFDAPEYDGKPYDLGLINHNTCLRYLKNEGTVKKIIFTSHGVIPPLEQAEEGADVYVGVSEEVCEAIPFPSVVIRNPIDLKQFRKRKPLKPTPRILYLATRHGPSRRIVEKACEGLDLEVVGRGPSICHDVPAAINRADLVIGLGRSAYEAMACGRNVVVYGYRGGDGFVTPRVFKTWRKRNLSGRTVNKMFTPHELRREIDKYDPSLDLQPLVSAQHAPVIAREYLGL